MTHNHKNISQCFKKIDDLVLGHIHSHPRPQVGHPWGLSEVLSPIGHFRAIVTKLIEICSTEFQNYT